MKPTTTYHCIFNSEGDVQLKKVLEVSQTSQEFYYKFHICWGGNLWLVWNKVMIVVVPCGNNVAPILICHHNRFWKKVVKLIMSIALLISNWIEPKIDFFFLGGFVGNKLLIRDLLVILVWSRIRVAIYVVIVEW